MRKRNKISTVVGTVVIAVTLLAACASSDENSVEEVESGFLRDMHYEIYPAVPTHHPYQYIQVIDRSNPHEPQELQVGDVFLGFTLERIEYTPSSPDSLPRIIGHFSGEAIVTGTMQSLSGCSTSPGIYAFDFHPNEPYRTAFPQFYPPAAITNFGFSFYNIQGISELLELSERDIRAIRNETIIGVRAEQVTIRIGNFFVSSRHPTGHFEILEVLDVGSLRLTRQTHYEYILFFGAVIIITLAVVSLGIWIYVRKTSAKKQRQKN